MSNHKQIIEQLLQAGTITAQQSEYIETVLQENPPHDIDAIIERAKELFPADTKAHSASDTLYFDSVEEVVEPDEVSAEHTPLPATTNSPPSSDTLYFENIEELVDVAAAPADNSNSLETLHIDGLMDAIQETVQDADATLIPPADERTLSQIAFETTTRYTATDANLIGEGGMGKVLRIFDTHLGRNIARKELHQSFMHQKSRGGTSIQQRFLREARITAQLEHPGIVPVYEVGEDADGTMYYTMQELTGRTLQDALKECNSLKERMQLMGHMVDFCQAIGFAHSKGIIHRDIKTENVMIDVHGQTIVLDWGLAKSISDTEEIDSSLTSTPMFSGKTSIGVVMGTPSYMSPEQAVGDIHTMDATTDVWSLGIVLFELITGRLPFADQNTMVLLENICKEDVPDVSDIEPKASKALCAILEKALQKSPSDRYQNAALLAQDLEAWYLGGSVSVYEYSWQDKVERWFVNHRKTALISLLGIALLMVSILIGTISTAQKNIEVKMERDRAVDAEQSVQISRVRAKLQAIESKIDKLETDGSYAKAYALMRAYVDLKDNEYARLDINADNKSDSSEDIHHLFRLATKVTPSKWIPYDGGEVYTIATNGTSVVVGYSNHEIRSYSLETGALMWSKTVNGRPIELRWITESKLLVLDVERSNIININTLSSSGEPIGNTISLPFTNDDFDYSRMFAYHQPTNSVILYTNDTIGSVQLDTGNRSDLFEVSKKELSSLTLSPDLKHLAIAHRSTITIVDLQTVIPTQTMSFVHPEQNLDNALDVSGIQDLVWVQEDTIVFRDHVKIWKLLLKNPLGEILYTTEGKGDYRSQLWHIENTDFVVFENNLRTDQFVKLNWRTLEPSYFTKEKYNLPNRSQIQSLQDGRWWAYSKEEEIILEQINGGKQLRLNQFSSDLITLHHADDGTLMAGNNTGELHMINFKAPIHPFFPFTSFADSSESSEFTLPEQHEVFRCGHLKDEWYYGIVVNHSTNMLYLLNERTKEQRSIQFDESLFLCNLLNNPKENHIGVSFSNPCDYELGGGYINQDALYEFGIVQIPFPSTSIDQLKVDLQIFDYDLKGSILQSKRTLIQDEKVYTDGDCLHFVDLLDENSGPKVQCTDEEGTPYQNIVKSPNGNMLALYNDSGRVAIWDRRTKEKGTYRSLDTLEHLSCDAASLDDQNHFNILCSNTLYIFDLNNDALIHSVPFVTDVTHLLTTDDGSISLVESKTRKRFWKINSQHEIEEFSLHKAETFTTISPDKRFVITKSGMLYHFETMTPLLSIGEYQLMRFSKDSKKMIVSNNNRLRVLPLPDLSSSYGGQKDSSLHNLRVCYRSLDIVSVVPFPKDDSPWAAQELCTKDK